MSIGKRLIEALDGLIESGATDNNGGTRRLEVTQGPRRIVCDVVTAGPLGCSLERFALETAELADATPPRLKAVSDALAARLTYLLEAISPVEVDEDHCVVQMRSNPPQRDDDGMSYYELLVTRGGQLSLCRYAKQPGGRRRQIPAQFTREVVARLAADFAAVLG